MDNNDREQAGFFGLLFYF